MGGNSAGQVDILVGTWVPTGVAGVVLIFRIYCKQVRQRGMWWDDAVFIVSWIFLFVSNIVQTIEVPLGFGRHIFDVPDQNKPLLGLLDEVTATLTILAAAWSKTAFAITLLRVVDGWAKKTVWVIIVTMNCTMVASVILGWAQCSPPEKLWDPDLPGACLPRNIRTDYNIFSGAYAGVMDLCLAALPWTVLPKLQMKTKEKIGVGVAMSMGVLAGAAAFAKCAVLPSLSTGDFTFYGADLVIWGTVEIAVTIIACSIPILRALLSDYKRSRYTMSKNVVGASTHGHAATKMSRRSALVTHARKPSRNDGSSDTASDRSILPDGDKRIIRTAEVTIEYTRRQQDDGAYEMNSFEGRVYSPTKI